jgi:hypothetical protein
MTQMICFDVLESETNPPVPYSSLFDIQSVKLVSTTTHEYWNRGKNWNQCHHVSASSNKVGQRSLESTRVLVERKRQNDNENVPQPPKEIPKEEQPQLNSDN